MKQYKIRAAVIQKILESTRTMNMLALTMNCSVWTVQRYLKNNNDNLTKATVLELLRKEFGLTDDKILEEKIEAKKVA